MLRAALRATTTPTTAVRTRGDHGAHAASDASANTTPNDGRYSVRSATRHAGGTTLVATRGTVAATAGRHALRQSIPRAMYTRNTVAGSVAAISFETIANAAPAATPSRYTRRCSARSAHCSAAA